MSARRKLIPAGQGGAGLIELVVALLVLAIATLGLGRLQIDARRVGLDAAQRWEAATLANDLLERLRVNRPALPGYGIAGLGSAGGSPLAVPPIDCFQVSCTAAELTASDLWQWGQALDGAATAGSAGGLVGALACVTLSGRRVTVEITWQGFRAPASAQQSAGCGEGNDPAPGLEIQRLRMSSWIGEG